MDKVIDFYNLKLLITCFSLANILNNVSGMGQGINKKQEIAQSIYLKDLSASFVY